tara:strand:- start:839 stop:1912 length:1074 start_codon:yes stop_codon:yes gene_type:complete
MTLKLKDLKFGELNNIKDNNVNPSGDRRRTNTTTAIRFATEKAFEINTLAQVTQFTGFVVGSRRISRPVAEYKSSILQIQETESEEGADTEYKNYLYKVYIPELEPLPAPVSFDDPVIGLYADVTLAEGVVGIGASTENLNGALVEVTYDDAENLNGPKITRLISTEVAKGLDMGDSMSLAGTFNSGVPTVTEPVDPNSPTINADRLRLQIKALGYTEKGNELSNGGDLDPDMVRYGSAVLRTIKQLHPGIQVRLTGGNDEYHQHLDYTSRHKSGRALDFTILPATQSNIDKVLKIIQGYSAGDSNFRFKNEYASLTRAATGKHFHISYRQGGTEGTEELREAQRLAKENKIQVLKV